MYTGGPLSLSLALSPAHSFKGVTYLKGANSLSANYRVPSIENLVLFDYWISWLFGPKSLQ